MSTTYRLAVIGAGRPWKSEGATGFGMAHHHVRGFLKTGRVELAAVSDIRQENLDAFVGEYGGTGYADYEAMLAAEKPDIVSICTWPHLHAPMAIAAAGAGARAIHCEKPMAPTWGEARAMHEACTIGRVMLTFDHQRRFNEPFQKARALLRDGAIGTLQRIEGQCGDMFDWGTHWLDMFFFYNEETPAQWVMGQIDCRKKRTVFGVPLETHGICHFAFANDVRATLVTGPDASIGCANRLIGSEGVMEIHWAEPWLVLRRNGHDQEAFDLADGIHGGVAHEHVTADIVRCLDTGDRPLLSSHYAIQATEVIFATYESSRRRARIDLPLLVDYNAFLVMLEEGVYGDDCR